MRRSVSPRSVMLLLVGCLSIWAGPVLAGPECTCRFAGESFALKSCACITTPVGPRIACCGMVLNNTSWTFTEKACPMAGLSDQYSAPMELAQSVVEGDRQIWGTTSPFHSLQFRVESGYYF